jgi:arylsulfatase A-like enzyme
MISLRALVFVVIALALSMFFPVNSPVRGETPIEPRSPVNKERRPNILLIVSDDQGFGDTGYTGNTVVQTPTLDALARRGVTMDHFYVSPVCSPTRASLLTGRYSLRTGVWAVTRSGETMRSEETTIAEVLKQAGYRTGLVGKWHNGAHAPYDPLSQGFDHFVGTRDGHLDYWNPHLLHGNTSRQRRGYLTDILSQEASRFIAREHGARPWFLMLTYTAPHSPFEPKSELFETYRRKGAAPSTAAIYAMIETMDRGISSVLKTVKATGADRDTIVVFLSDNGPVHPDGTARFNAGLKGAKGSVDEGGLRSPLSISWPGRIEGGRTISTPAQHIDLFPTLLSLANVQIPKAVRLDGASLVDTLFSVTPQQSDRMMFTHHFQNIRRRDETAVARFPGAVRMGRWLALNAYDDRWQLYDIDRDPGQKSNVATGFPETVASLATAYARWFDDVSRDAGQRLPTWIGLNGYDNVTLPAHEAWLEGKGIAYSSGYGWTHDWISDWNGADAYAWWPIRIATTAQYRVKVQYLTGKAQGQAGLRMRVQDQILSASLPRTRERKTEAGRRLYPSGESATRAWASETLGTIMLSAGDAEIVIERGSATADIVPDIKAITLELVAR